MNFEEIIENLGSIGKYQKIQIFLLCLPHMSTGFFMVISVILLGVPEHRCKIPDYDNDTYSIQGPTHQSLVDRYIPASSDDTLIYDKCRLYTMDTLNGTTPHNHSFGNDSTVKCDEWVYSTSTFTETFLSKHNLVCDRGAMLATAKMMFFVGVLVGAFVFGNLADRLGRKSTMCIALGVLLVSSVGLAWAPNLPVYITLRFFVGAASNGIVLTTFVLSMELVGRSHRVPAALLNGAFFATGEVLVAGLGYGFRNWQYIEIIAGGATILFLPYIWTVHESPRWLLNRKRVKDAERVLQRIAKANNTTLPPGTLTNYQQQEQPKGNLSHLFTSKIMLTRTLILFCNWFVIAMTFYGLSMNTGNLGGNFYLNFMLIGAMDYPATVVVIVFLDRLGRRKLHCIAMTTGGLACLSTILTTSYGKESLHTLTVVLVLIGKMGAGVAFGTIFLLSSELFPTIVRNAGMGASSCFARFGSMLAPYVIELSGDINGSMGRTVPLIVFGAASVAAGLLALLLPETLHKALPDTIEDGKKFGTAEYDSWKKEGNINATFTSDLETK